MAEFLSTDKLAIFQKNGFVILEKFLSDEETSALKEEYKNLVDKMDENGEKTVFASNPNDKGIKESHEEDEYFITSGNKIRYFFEGKAFDEEGKLKFDKYQSLNKVGHALHWLNPTFKQITFSNKVKNVIRWLNMTDPVIIHSMYINKPPIIGSEVVPHQDATYLFCEPADKVIGLWIALEDTDTSNGCLWFIPGSQTDPVERRMVRVQDGDRVKLKYTGNNPNYKDRKFVPVPVKKGDLIVIHGKVVHKSEANASLNPRPIYTFHVMDTNGSYFSESNWIQQTDNFKFTPIFMDD